MATKRKKVSAKRAKVVTAPGTLVVTMNANSMKTMIAKCIRETGKVSFGIRQVSVTKLGEVTEAAVIVN